MSKSARALGLLAAIGLVAAATPAAADPPMSWGTWNSFGNAYDSGTIRRQAETMLKTGLFAAGYRTILLDEGWWLGARDASGNMTVDARQWPAIAPGERNGDITNIVRWLHARGFKVGIYTDTGAVGCSFTGPDSGGQRPDTGSYDRYHRDFTWFARHGFDYVKVDWCGGNRLNLDPYLQYDEVARAIGDAERETGRRLLLSICEWGKQSPWTWAPGIGGLPAVLWRTGGDITDPIVDTTERKHLDRAASLPMIWKSYFDGLHPEAQHTGYYNDLDMMVVGLRGTDAAMDRLHMSLWAIAAAPMMIGADVTRLTPDQLAVLRNADAIAINQDAAGLQGYPVPGATPAGVEVTLKPLAKPGGRALLVVDRRLDPVDIAITPDQLGFPAGTTMRAREIWSGRTVTAADTLKLTAQPQVAQLWLIDGVEGPRVTRPVVPERESATAPGSPWRYASARDVPGNDRLTRLFIRYRLTAGRAAMTMMQIGDTTPTAVQLTPAGGGVAVVVARLQSPTNIVRFWPAHGSATATVTTIEVADRHLQ